MSSGITAGFYNLLAGDPTLVAMLGTYNGKPSIFTTPFIPTDPDRPDQMDAAVYPALRTWSEGSAPRGLCLSDPDLAVTFARRVWVHGDSTGDTGAVDDIGVRVRELFVDFTNLAISGYVVTGTSVSGPTEAETDEESYGRAVDVQVWMARA